MKKNSNAIWHTHTHTRARTHTRNRTRHDRSDIVCAVIVSENVCVDHEVFTRQQNRRRPDRFLPAVSPCGTRTHTRTHTTDDERCCAAAAVRRFCLMKLDDRFQLVVVAVIIVITCVVYRGTGYHRRVYECRVNRGYRQWIGLLAPPARNLRAQISSTVAKIGIEGNQWPYTANITMWLRN